jgi:hypothetical protein
MQASRHAPDQTSPHLCPQSVLHHSVVALQQLYILPYPARDTGVRVVHLADEHVLPPNTSIAPPAIIRLDTLHLHTLNSDIRIEKQKNVSASACSRHSSSTESSGENSACKRVIVNLTFIRQPGMGNMSTALVSTKRITISYLQTHNTWCPRARSFPENKHGASSHIFGQK